MKRLLRIKSAPFNERILTYQSAQFRGNRSDELRNVFVPTASQLELFEDKLKREAMFVSQLGWSLPPAILEEVQAANDPAREETDEPAPSIKHEEEFPPCPLTIDSKTRKAFINGIAVEGQLTPEQIKVLEVLVGCWPNRLSKDELSKIKGVGDPLGVFKRLIEREPWDRLFSLAGRERNKYGWRPELLK